MISMTVVNVYAAVVSGVNKVEALVVVFLVFVRNNYR